MLPQQAQFETSGNSVEASVMEMLDRMQTGRLKVLAHLGEWLDEFRMYHRKDGRIVKENDDLLCATRYALMMLHSARTNDGSSQRAPGMAKDQERINMPDHLQTLNPDTSVAQAVSRLRRRSTQRSLPQRRTTSPCPTGRFPKA